MLRWARDAAALALILTVGPGCGSKTAGSGPSDASTDGGTGEAAAVEAGEAGPDCGPMPPTGTQLFATTDPVVLFGLTEDDHAVFEDLTTQHLQAVALTGGAPSDIGKMTSQSGTVWTHGPVVLYLPTATDPSSEIAPLSSWTAAGGTSVMSNTVLALDGYDYTYDATKDGQYVAFYQDTVATKATLTLSTVDGKTQTPLVPGIDLTDQYCFPPLVQFVGDTLIAQYCLPPGVNDAGTPLTEAVTIALYTAPGTTPTILGSTFKAPPSPVTVDPTGTLMLLPDPVTNKGLYLYPITGGARTTVDATALSGMFAPNGDIFVTTSTGALARYAAATGTSTTLVTSGPVFPYDLSPDGNWLQAISKQDSTTGLVNLLLVSATTPGPATSVVGTLTANPAGFTADSKFSLFGTNIGSTFGATTFDLDSSPVPGGTAKKVLSVDSYPLATTGSKFVLNTNASKATGAADIVELDLSSTAGPTTLVSQADPYLLQTSKKDIVYSWYCTESAKAGIWTLTPP